MDARKFSDLLIKIYDAAYAPDNWTDAMDACLSVTQAEHVMFFTQSLNEDIAFSAHGGSSSLGPLAGQIQEYNRRFSGATGYDDVGAAYMKRAAIGEPVLDTDIWTLAYLRSRPELQFNQEHMGIFRKMYINISPDPLLTAAALFYFDKAVDEIPKADPEMARLFGPHLTKALDLSRWADGLRRKYRAVLSVLDKIEMGICIANERGDVVLHNRHADDVFSKRDGLWLGPDKKLRSEDEETLASVLQAIRSVSQTALGANKIHAVEIPIERRATTNALLLIASPLRDADMELERHLTGCLLTIIDTDHASAFRVDAFGQAYGLTPSEKRAANLLFSGLTTPQIAEELGIAPSTAKTHVAQAFQKTRSANRVNFVWKAMQYAPPVV